MVTHMQLHAFRHKVIEGLRQWHRKQDRGAIAVFGVDFGQGSRAVCDSETYWSDTDV